MEFSVKSGSPEKQRSACIVVGVFEPRRLSGTAEQLDEISALIPKEWLPAASGSAEECALGWKNQLDNGADGVVIHGSTPDEFAPVINAYELLKETSAA